MMNDDTRQALESASPGTAIELRERTVPLTVTDENIGVNAGEGIALGLEGSRGGKYVLTVTNPLGSWRATLKRADENAVSGWSSLGTVHIECVGDEAEGLS